MSGITNDSNNRQAVITPGTTVPLHKIILGTYLRLLLN
jgi:hypothetical protein